MDSAETYQKPGNIRQVFERDILPQVLAPTQEYDNVMDHIRNLPHIFTLPGEITGLVSVVYKQMNDNKQTFMTERVTPHASTEPNTFSRTALKESGKVRFKTDFDPYAAEWTTDQWILVHSTESSIFFPHENDFMNACLIRENHSLFIRS